MDRGEAKLCIASSDHSARFGCVRSGGSAVLDGALRNRDSDGDMGCAVNICTVSTAACIAAVGVFCIDAEGLRAPGTMTLSLVLFLRSARTAGWGGRGRGGGVGDFSSFIF